MLLRAKDGSFCSLSGPCPSAASLTLEIFTFVYILLEFPSLQLVPIAPCFSLCTSEKSMTSSSLQLLFCIWAVDLRLSMPGKLCESWLNPGFSTYFPYWLHGKRVFSSFVRRDGENQFLLLMIFFALKFSQLKTLETKISWSAEHFV